MHPAKVVNGQSRPQLILSVRPQAALLDSLFGTERGLTPSAETRGEISELISQLEAGTPNNAPNEVRLLCFNVRLAPKLGFCVFILHPGNPCTNVAPQRKSR